MRNAYDRGDSGDVAHLMLGPGPITGNPSLIDFGANRIGKAIRSKLSKMRGTVDN